MAKKSENYLTRPGGLFMQWAGLLAGPVAWGLHMQAKYSLVPWVCNHGRGLPLYLITIGALLITAAGGFAGWRGWQEGGGEEKESNGGGSILSRARFMGALGLLTSAMFFLLIIAQAIPDFYFHPCQK